MVYTRPNLNFVNTFLFYLEVYFTGDVDFTWMVSDCEELGWVI
jgi:hypothetical protein